MGGLHPCRNVAKRLTGAFGWQPRWVRHRLKSAVRETEKTDNTVFSVARGLWKSKSVDQRAGAGDGARDTSSCTVDPQLTQQALEKQ